MSELIKFEKSVIKVALFDGTTKENVVEVWAVEGDPLEKYKQALELVKKGVDQKGLTSFVPLSSIKQALSNMIVHRDYDMPGFSTISILDDRVEFLSLGGIGGGLTITDIMNGATFCRNEELALAFEKAGITRNLGNGLQIMQGNRDGHCHLIAGPASFLVVLGKNDVPGKTSVDMAGNGVNLQNGPYNIPETLPPEERVFELLKLKKVIGRKDVEVLLKCSSFPARLALQKLLESGRIKATGNARSTRYVIK